MTPRRQVLCAVLFAFGCGVRDVDLTPRAGGDAAAAARFAADPRDDVVDEEQAPRVIYPSDDTMLPRNLEHMLVQWRAPAQLDLFEVRFDSELIHVRYYTSERSFQPAAPELRSIAEQHAGRSLSISVRGLALAQPDRIFRSQGVTLQYSRSQVIGAVYYWSTAVSGVMRAHIAAGSATKFFADPQAPDSAVCVGCHTVSRDGRRLAAGYDGERLREVTIPERAVLIPRGATAVAPMPKPTMKDPMMPMMPMMPAPMPAPMPAEVVRGPDYGWGTFDPGGTRLLYADKGKLSVIDAETGEARKAVALPEGAAASHPDWSPDGRFVAVTYLAAGKLKNKEVEGSSIARLPVAEDGSFGSPEILVQSQGKDDALFFPVYSPDSHWLAFVRARGKSKDNVSAELFVVAADGQSPPIALERANHRVRDLDGVIDTGSTMPTWAPSTRLDTFWLAFSSVRDYGEVLDGAARDQLWAVAIDPARIAAGEDPSHAAFWLPFQDVAEGNHRAYWALADEDECAADGELCDDLDNDCDGIVDEDCCTPSPETCGDGLDNDCNGVADEQCGCGDTELCANGQDDDCDLDVDEDCVI